MNVTFDKKPDCLSEATAIFPAEEVNAERSSIVTSFSKEASLPGFRAGKAPESLISKRFAKDIEERLENTWLNKLYRHALEEEKLDFIAIQEQTVTQEENGDYTAKIEFIMAPEFELGEYKNVAITIPNFDVTDEMLDGEILNIQRQQAKYNDKEDGPAERDDIAVISYSSTFEGKPSVEVFEDGIEPYAEKDEYWIKVGDDSNFLPGFSDEVTGMVIGSEKKVSHTFAEDFYIELLQGKTLDFTVTLSGLKSEELESVEEIAKKILGEEGTEEGLRERVNQYLVQQLEKSAKEAKADAILEKISEGLDFALPQAYLEAETEGHLARMLQQAKQYGMTEDDLPKVHESFTETATENAKKSLKYNFILLKIASVEEIKVDEQEYLQSIVMRAYQEGQDPQKVIAELEKSGRKKQIMDSLIVEKVVDFLIDNADITEEEPTETE